MSSRRGRRDAGLPVDSNNTSAVGNGTSKNRTVPELEDCVDSAEQDMV